MKIPPRIFLLSIFLICSHLCIAQVKEAGPVITEYGKVWPVEGQDYPLKKDLEYKAVFDVMNSPDSHEMVNPSIETVARYLNMHAQNGISEMNLKAALIIHNKASKDVMNDKAYEERYGTVNPNRKLIEQLIKSGVDVIFCGQSSLSRNIPKENIIPDVKLSLSAMSALIQLQDSGYRLIKF